MHELLVELLNVASADSRHICWCCLGGIRFELCSNSPNRDYGQVPPFPRKCSYLGYEDWGSINVLRVDVAVCTLEDLQFTLLARFMYCSSVPRGLQIR